MAPPPECLWMWTGRAWFKVSDDCPAEESCQAPTLPGTWIGQPDETPCLA
jgi:hypothetical protein